MINKVMLKNNQLINICKTIINMKSFVNTYILFKHDFEIAGKSKQPHL